MTTLTEIEKRWNERIVPNNWHTMGREGTKAYIEKYGKKLGEEKRHWLYEHALRNGCSVTSLPLKRWGIRQRKK